MSGMRGSTLAPGLRLSYQLARQTWRNALVRLWMSPLLRWRFNVREPQKLTLAPQDLRAADPTRAAEIVAGRYTFAGKTVSVHDISPFAIVPPSPVWRDTLFGFTWLRHLRAADGPVGRQTARRLVGDFIRAGLHYQPGSLEPLQTARRLLSWVSQSPLVLDGADRGFHRAFLRAIAWQTAYLLRAGRLAEDGMPRLVCAIAVSQACLCLADKGNLRRQALRWLVQELGKQIPGDGLHIGRNPQAIIDLLLDLLPLRQSFSARNAAVPAELPGAIDRMMPMLRFFRHADGAFAAFNGMGYTQTHLIATLLAYDDTRGKPVQNAPYGGYQRVEGQGSVLLVDAGPPPPMPASQDAHAGALSFEFSADNHRIIVNCGAPTPGRENWRHLSRSTGAHSTAIVGDVSSCVFAGGSRRQGPAGRMIISGPRKVGVQRDATPTETSLLLTHDGYAAQFGLIHERRLILSSITGALEGRDRFIDTKANAWQGKQPVLLRFHLHPAVAARPAAGDTQIVITLPNGREWIFLCDAPFSLAETVHLANPEGPRRSTQIVVALPEQEHALAWALIPADLG